MLRRLGVMIFRRLCMSTGKFLHPLERDLQNYDESREEKRISSKLIRSNRALCGCGLKFCHSHGVTRSWG
jgi:hypothetical protein